MKLEQVTSILLALAAMGSIGCKKTKEQAATNPKAVEAMGHYVKAFNTLLKDPKKMIENYYGAIPEDGPKAGEKYTLKMSSFLDSSITEAEEAIAAAIKSSPASLKHIAPLATASLLDIKKVEAVYRAADNYYSAEDFKDDKGAKGRELHTEFIKLAKQFNSSFDRFEVALDEVEDLQSEEELKKFSNKSTYGYWFRFFNLQAKKMVNAKPEAHQKAFAAVDAAHKGLGAFLAEQKQPNSVFVTYKENADSFFNICKRLQRASNDKQADLDSLQSELTSGYNFLVTLTDGLRTLEGYGQLK